MPVKIWVPLLGITLSAFVFNTSEYMPIGLLSDIAADFGMTEAACGMIVSVYAWAVMILSLPLMLLASRMAPKKLLIGVIVLFGACQLASAASVSFEMLTAARLGVAAAHAVFWSIATPIAVRIVPARKSSLAVSMVGMGTSVAMIFGLPAGRMLGLAIGWRCTFLVVGIASLAIAACLTAVFPKLDAGKPFTVAKLPGLLRTRPLVGIYVTTVVAIIAYFTGYGFIEPFFAQVALMTDGEITFALVLFGVAGLAGSLLFARLGSVGLPTFVKIAVGGLALSLLLMGPGAALGAPASCLVCVIWGISASLFNVSFNAAVIKCSPAGASSVATSIYSGLYNLGIGTGTWLGGVVTSTVGIGSIGYVGGVIALAGFAYVCLRFVGLLRGVKS